MKKIISILVIIAVFLTATISNTFAVPNAREAKTLVIAENKLKQIKNGKNYVNVVNNVMKKYWNDRTYLQNLKINADKILKSNSVKNSSTKLFIAYLSAKIGSTLQYPTTISSGNSSTTTNNPTTNTGTTNNVSTSTGTTSTGTTTSTGLVVEAAKGNILTKAQYDVLISGTYYQLTSNANFSFIEFSDLECPYCARLHNETILDQFKAQYGVLIDYRIIHFPLPSHANAEIAAEIAECVGLQKGAGTFYNFINETYRYGKTTKEDLVERAVSLGVNRENLNKCIDEGTFKQFVQLKKTIAEKMLGISGTPSVLIRNNTSGKYVIVSGLQNLIDYQKAIESLYK